MVIFVAPVSNCGELALFGIGFSGKPPKYVVADHRLLSVHSSIARESKWRYIMRAITIDADTGKRVYTRKEVADLVGASTQSIRLWEDAGAIPASVRDEGGYRYWYEEDLEAIKAYASLPRKAKLKK